MEIQESQDVLIVRINRLLRLIKNLNESIDLRKEYNDSNFMIEQDVSLKSTFEKELFELLAQMKITLPFQKAA
jgi:hypothetical protein